MDTLFHTILCQKIALPNSIKAGKLRGFWLAFFNVFRGTYKASERDSLPTPCLLCLWSSPLTQYHELYVLILWSCVGIHTAYCNTPTICKHIFVFLYLFVTPFLWTRVPLRILDANFMIKVRELKKLDWMFWS